jgi:hypothetical protein
MGTEKQVVRKSAVIARHLPLTIIITTEPGKEGKPGKEEGIMILYTVVSGAINAPPAERTLLGLIAGHIRSKEGSSDSGRPICIETDLSLADFQRLAGDWLSEIH